MRINDSWTNEYGWIPIQNGKRELEGLKGKKIRDVSRIFLHAKTPSEIKDDFLKYISNSEKNLIALCYGILVLRFDDFSAGFYDDTGPLQIYFHPNLTGTIVKKMETDAPSNRFTTFSTKETPEFANEATLAMLGEEIREIELLRLKPVFPKQEHFERFGALSITLGNNQKMFIGMGISTQERERYLSILFPEETLKERFDL